MEENRDPRVDDENDSSQTFEIDLEESAASDVDGVIEEAVAAVDSAAKRSPRELRPDEAAEPQDADEELFKLQSENLALKERQMRTLADFENFRKRTDREKEALRRFAIFDFVKDFLGVIDNLERAMAAGGSTDDLKKGLEMVLRQQEDILGRHGVESISAEGEPFDPAVHEAVTREESDEVEVPTVKQEFQRGYLLHDRLLRPSMVTVAVPVPGSSARAQETTDGEGSADDGSETEAEAVGEGAGHTVD